MSEIRPDELSGREKPRVSQDVAEATDESLEDTINQVIKFRKNVRLAPFTTFKIGGRAEYFYEAKTAEDFISAIELAKELKFSFKIFAGGSNVVFPDGKLRGLLICLRGGQIEVRGNKLIVNAGVDLASVIAKSISLGLRGLETLSGIPGTLGGAVVGNAGAYGHSISESAKRVEIWDGKRRRWLKNSECRFGYRESIFKHKSFIILQAELIFKKGEKNKLEKISQDIIKVREKKYGMGIKCPGSYFKNVLVKDISKKSLKLIDKKKVIEGKIPAGYLLEEIGARGMRLGGIQIADFHGNLLMNTGKARASEAKKLAKILKQKVYKKFGIKLEEEVRYF